MDILNKQKQIIMDKTNCIFEIMYIYLNKWCLSNNETVIDFYKENNLKRIKIEENTIIIIDIIDKKLRIGHQQSNYFFEWASTEDIEQINNFEYIFNNHSDILENKKIINHLDNKYKKILTFS